MIVIRAIYDGRSIAPDEKARSHLKAFKRWLSVGDPVAVTFQKWGRARTVLQQRLLHGLIGRYARANKEPLAVVKIRWKVDLGYYVPADKILSGELDMPKWRGAFHDLHAVYPEMHPERTIAFVRSEAAYTTRMEKEFIDYAMQSCEASGVDISDIMQSLAELSK